jgi:hypothetical protein
MFDETLMNAFFYVGYDWYIFLNWIFLMIELTQLAYFILFDEKY